MQVSDNVYAYLWEGDTNNCNTYLIKSDFLILVDPGLIRGSFGESCLEPLKRSLLVDGFKIKDIGLILLTHGHPDHCESAGIIKNESGAYIAFHYSDENFISGTGQYLLQKNKDLPVPEADFYIGDGDLNAGRFLQEKITVLHTPGHSPGSLCFYLEKERILITGDTVFEGNAGRTDLPGGNKKSLTQSIDRLALLEAEYILPGHLNIIKGSSQITRNFQVIKKMLASKLEA